MVSLPQAVAQFKPDESNASYAALERSGRPWLRFGKHNANQMIALLVHIPKSRRNENPYRVPTFSR